MVQGNNLAFIDNCNDITLIIVIILFNYVEQFAKGFAAGLSLMIILKHWLV